MGLPFPASGAPESPSSGLSRQRHHTVRAAWQSERLELLTPTLGRSL